MLGDVYDFCTILEWTGRFWSRHETLYWNSAFRFAVCDATKELCLRFERAEMSHRRHHMLSCIDYDDPSDEQNVCFLSFSNSRRVVYFRLIINL